jgi:hypothetical protein
MAKSLAKLLPVAEHRQEIVDRIMGNLLTWLRQNESEFRASFARSVSALCTEKRPNPEFSAVQRMLTFQLLLIGQAVAAARSDDAARASILCSEALALMEAQIAIDKVAYEVSLRMNGAENIQFAYDTNFMLMLACTALWVGTPLQVARVHAWFTNYRANGHLREHAGDACFFEFVIWMLDTQCAVAPQARELAPMIYGPYLGLVDKFDHEGGLAQEMQTVADFHLYRSDDFPKAEPFPSFYGEILGAFPAELFGYAALRLRMTGQATHVLDHPLLTRSWSELVCVVAPPGSAQLSDLRQRFSAAFDSY